MVARIACLDLDAFFVEVALKDHPELRNKPLVVGGNDSGRGVVCSASYEARPFGVRSGMPVWQAVNRCPGLIVLPVPNSIEAFSRRVRKRLELLCPVVDTASIDEFFLDFTGCDRLYPSNLALADKLWQAIAEDPALPVTIGIGTNRLVAKVASDVAKPRGILEIFPGSEARFLATLEVKRIPGVGPKTQEQLQSFGVTRVSEVTAIPLDWWQSMLGKAGKSLYESAGGHCASPVVPDAEKHHQKRLSREQTLPESTESADILLGLLSRLSEEALYDMRALNLTCGCVSVKLRYDDFSTGSRSKKIERTNHDKAVFSVAEELFRKVCTRRVKVRLLGIALEDLQTAGCTEGLWSLLEPVSRQKRNQIVDSIRGRFGFKSLLRIRSLSWSPGNRQKKKTAESR